MMKPHPELDAEKRVPLRDFTLVHSDANMDVLRATVPGGWLYLTRSPHGAAMAFVPDPAVYAPRSDTV